MNVPIRGRLSTMMALIYAVQGAFWPLLAVHMRDLGVGGKPPTIESLILAILAETSLE